MPSAEPLRAPSSLNFLSPIFERLVVEALGAFFEAVNAQLKVHRFRVFAQVEQANE
jgi:hypothetical protein